VALLFAVLFLVVPIVELYLIIQVGGSIGVLPTIGLLILISVAGGWLVKREGVSVIARIRRELAAGRLPTEQVVDGALVMGAGALLLTPGFVTDLVGILFLLPPSRAVFRRSLIRRFRHRAMLFAAGSFAPGPRRWASDDIIVVDGEEATPTRRDIAGGPPVSGPGADRSG
jgi:UPF0716 protein FxsA